MKRASYGLLNIPKCKRVRKKVFTYVYLNTVCLTCHTLCVQWLTYRSTLLSGDVEMNPGPSHGCLSFCSWNLNSICAHDFLRVSLIEAYNTVYNYDLIGIVETHLDNTVDETKLAIDGYSFYKSNHPQNGKRGGVGLYVKESFPTRERDDLETLSECIVCEIQIKGKKYFFNVLYRSPSQSQEELKVFINKFELMLSKMASENPYCVVITGDFNARSTQWWENDIENDAGRLIEPFTADMGFEQLISQATHIIGESQSCIDLIFIDQPNLFIESGVHGSLHEQCHHQIIYGKISIENLPPPPYKRRIWFYDRADVTSIMKSIEMFRWQEVLSEIDCPNSKVRLLNDVLINIFSNFIPNKQITVRPRQAPWITQSIKNFIRKKNKAYKTFIKNGQPEDRREGINNMVSQVSKLIEDAKNNYFAKIGNKLSDPTTGIKSYWSMVNKMLNKAKIPLIPPLFDNDIFVLDFTAKAQIFNDYFILQCTTLDTCSKIPRDVPLCAPLLNAFDISDEKILRIIRTLNPNKAHGWDEISIRMIKICDFSLVTPLRLIFEACKVQDTFPEIWKRANVVPIHKKGEKNLKTNYRPISLLPIFGKMFSVLWL